jgi:hypothetical protein
MRGRGPGGPGAQADAATRPRKLRAILLDRYLRRRAPPMTQPFAQTLAPNDTWCIDFKGKFRMQDGNW